MEWILDGKMGFSATNYCRFSRSLEVKKRTSKGAVYTAFVAPSRPKNESVTNGPTNGRTHAHIESLRRD